MEMQKVRNNDRGWKKDRGLEKDRGWKKDA